MAGMAEMAQLAALSAKYKYEEQQQHYNRNITASINSKEQLYAKTPKEENSVYKPKQCRWRDLISAFGHKANNKGLNNTSY